MKNKYPICSIFICFVLNQKAKRIRVQQLRKCNSFPIASYKDKCHFAGDNLTKIECQSWRFSVKIPYFSES